MSGKVTLEHDWFPWSLPPNVVIGARSWLYSSYAFLHYRSECPCGFRVGHDSGIYVGTCFDLGPRGEVEIGDYCTLVSPTISTNGRIVIGDHVLISAGVVMADSFAAAPISTDRCGTKQTVIVIGDEAWIGARAVLLSGARLGKGAIVGAGTVVDFEVAPYAIVAGNPARVVGWAARKGQPRYYKAGVGR